MLLSHEHRFIFIKTHKTAGTSIEIDLAKIMGPRDIVTALFPPEPGHHPRNYKNRNPVRRLLKQNFRNHMPATLVRDLVGRRVFDGYTKFCVDREPVAKCLSQYAMFKNAAFRKAEENALSWEEYLERGQLPVDAEIYLDSDGSLLVDRVLRYEHLAEDMADLARQLGLPFNGLTAQAKVGFAGRTEVTVTPEQRRQIYDVFAPTLRYTGYEL